MQQFTQYAGAVGRTRVDPIEARARFIVRTYNHLFGAIILFALIEVGLFMTGIAPLIARARMGTDWLCVRGGFMGCTGLAIDVANRATSMAAQYAALVGFVC